MDGVVCASLLLLVACFLLACLFSAFPNLVEPKETHTHSHTHTHSFLIHCPLPSAQQMCRSKCSPSALQVTLAATTGRPCLGMVQSPFPLVRVFVVGGERVQSTCNRTNTKCGGKKARMTHSHSHSFTHSFTHSLFHLLSHSLTLSLTAFAVCIQN